jgi:hypothetical protein
VVVGVEPLHGHEPLHDGDDAANGLEIEADDLLNVLVLDLHGDAPALFRARRMDLTEGSAGDRLPLEVVEGRVDLSTELLLDALCDLGEGTRRHLILESFELLTKLLRKKVRMIDRS